VRGLRARAVAWLGPVVLLACTSAAPAPEPSPLRQQAQRAAETGGSRFAARHWEASARSFERAAEIYGALDDSAAEAAARRGQAEALRRAGKIDDAAVAFQSALAIDQRAGRPLDEARDLAGLARCASARGEMDLAIATAQQALERTPASDPLHALLENDLALYLLERGDVADRKRIHQLLESALEESRSRGDVRGMASAELNLGRAYLHFGENDLAESPLDEALAHFRTLDDPEGLAHAHEELARLFDARAQPDRARFHREQARRGYAFLGDEAGVRRLERGP
jgi:tetratricopeptide (TPR) repeat protein